MDKHTFNQGERAIPTVPRDWHIPLYANREPIEPEIDMTSIDAVSKVIPFLTVIAVAIIIAGCIGIKMHTDKVIYNQNNERSHMVQPNGNRIYKAGHDTILSGVSNPVYYKATVAVVDGGRPQ